MVVSLVPFNLQLAAIHDNTVFATRASCLTSCHSRSACACSAGLCYAAAALPNANPNAVRTHFGKFDVTAFGKSGMEF